MAEEKKPADGCETSQGSEIRHAVERNDVFSSTESSDKVSDDDDLGKEQRDEITALARQFSQLSRHSSTYPDKDSHGEEPPNPFLDLQTHPELDPHSEKFNQRKWLKSTLQIISRDPERYPRRTAGVSFRNLSAYGYGTPADYQANFANLWLKFFGWCKTMLGYGHKVRIDILRDFEGLVRSGEMLVVLGRPGRFV